MTSGEVNAGEVEILLLGPLALLVDGRPVAVTAAQQRVVLAALALRAGESITAESLSELLWADRIPSTARTSLHNTIRRLRQLTFEALVVTSPAGYQIDLPRSRVDACRFADLVQQARRSVAQGETDAAVAAYGEALDCWRSDPLPDVSSAGWIADAVSELVELRIAAVEELADLEIATGVSRRSLELLIPMARAWPLREGLRARLMLALGAAGRTAEALEEYVDVRRALVDELGVEPGPALRGAHAELLRIGTDSAPVTVARPAQLPFPRTRVVGRSHEVETLDALLAEAVDTTSGSNAPVSCVLFGPAGVGKTTLALDWAHRAADSFPDGQLALNLRGFDPHGPPLTTSEIVRRFLIALGVPVEEIPVDADVAHDRFRTLVADLRLLVLFDNARDAAQVRDLLPTGRGSLALITSRHDLAALAATHGTRLIGLPVLEDLSAESLLAERLGGGRLEAEPEAVRIIVERCGGLPLALALVAARLTARPDLKLSVLAQQLQAGSSLDVLHVGDPTTDLRAVLSWSIDALTPAAAEAFALLGRHPGPATSAAALASMGAMPLAKARESIAELSRAHLVTDRDPDRVMMHDMVRDHARELFAERFPDGSGVGVVRRLADHYLHSSYSATRTMFASTLPFALDDPTEGVLPETFVSADDGSAWLDAEQATLVRVATLVAEVPGLESVPWRLGRTITGFLWDRRAGSEMVQLHEQGLRAATRAGDIIGQADARHGLGDAYLGLERWAESEAELLQSAELFAGAGNRLGESDVAATLSRLFEAQGDLATSRFYVERSLAIAREIGDRIGEAIALNNIGWLHVEAGEYDAAVPQTKAALVIYREQEDQNGIAYALDTIGRAYLGRGDVVPAVEAFSEAVTVARTVGQYFNQAENLTHLGEAQHAAGDLAATRSAWEEALVVLEELEHPQAEALRARLALLPTP